MCVCVCRLPVPVCTSVSACTTSTSTIKYRPGRAGPCMGFPGLACMQAQSKSNNGSLYRKG